MHPPVAGLVRVRLQARAHPAGAGAQSQLGVGWGDCRGLTVAEIEGIDFERLDLSEFTDNLMDGGTEPAISLPEAGDTQAVMRERVRDFYSRGE